MKQLALLDFETLDSSWDICAGSLTPVWPISMIFFAI